ncbi:MAG: hypothetical protein HRT35_30290 [Algicola sp.]|nr:hypothetical protein [Algicola sp.]
MTIQINKVAPKNALQWLSRAWVLFKEQPGLWMQSAFFMFAAMIASGLLQKFGMLLFALVHPFLMAGFYHMALNAKNGVNSPFSDLFCAFKDQRIRKVLLQLGLVSFGLSILLTPLSPDFYLAMTTGEQPDPQATLLFSLINILSSMLFYYAVPIAYFYHEQDFLVIMKTSFMACLHNLPALFVFSILSLGLGLATFPTMGLGMIIVAPWLMLAGYLSFSDILCPDLPDDKNGEDSSNGDDDFTFTV